MSRSTKASNALARLKERSGNQSYSMTMTGSGHFFLTEGLGQPPLCPPMELDDFVAFVNAQGPQKAKRISNLDVAFEKQLAAKKTPKP